MRTGGSLEVSAGTFKSLEPLAFSYTRQGRVDPGTLMKTMPFSYSESFNIVFASPGVAPLA
eukprot:7708489-Karenia_brevis.AAC.1